MSATRSDPPVEPNAPVQPVDTGPPVEPVGTPALRVVRGNPTPDELAALLAVLSCAGGGTAAPARTPGSTWAAGARAGRGQVPGAGGWRRSGLPR